ncbi:Xaa-Pro peptidase family protein [uncultured Maribacter sp.]|uniref:Xaa-Pro peptidase family protein n=1 Tax=uncultured Maribacter sp. TaxID=431308 RepID=UPI0030EE17DA|tara:strand:- start:9281 stop:10636 length:1356 start_codon:yes stop_codon:yes gene_type:complete
MKITTTIFTLLFSTTLLFAQTPVQSYFEWTDLPFSMEELHERRQKLMSILLEQQKNGLVVIPANDGFSFGETFRQSDDFYYFTGLELPNSLLVLDLSDQSSIIYTPERDLRFENGSRVNDFPGMLLLNDKAISERSGVTLTSIAEFTTRMNKEALKGSTILINNGRQGLISFASNDYIASYSPIQVLLKALQQKHAGLNYENIFESIANVRMIKSPGEIEIMRKAAAITVEGIKQSAKKIKAGVDERYLEGILEGNYKVNGSQRLAFGSIIKSGPNSHWPWRILATHYNRRNRIMENGDLVIFDVGCEYEQYVSDIGRTFPVSGKFTDRQRDILVMETKIADEIIKFLKPGITFKDIQTLTNSIIPEDAKKYMQVGLFFGHHLGLSTGDPSLSDAQLQPGMIFTVEPWYYNHDENISVFTEDMILITKNGCEVLSSDLPRTPEALEALMKG